MMKVAFRLDSLLRGDATPSEASLARIAATASLAGVDSLIAVLPESNSIAWLKPLLQVKTIFDGPLAVTCASSDDLDLISKLRPDLAIVTSAGFYALGGDQLVDPATKSLCQSLRTTRVPFGLHVGTSVADIKVSRQFEADVVVLPVANMLNAEDALAAVSMLEELEAAAIAAGKLGLRVLFEGDLERSSWAAFNDLDLVEGVILHKSIVDRAIQLGLGASVRELKMMY
jgi:pyridoxine 5'-phosphate synthase PdxJ